MERFIGEGRPLDDVIVHAHDVRGDSEVLEIQVKRTVIGKNVLLRRMR